MKDDLYKWVHKELGLVATKEELDPYEDVLNKIRYEFVFKKRPTIQGLSFLRASGLNKLGLKVQFPCNMSCEDNKFWNMRKEKRHGLREIVKRTLETK
ncbi:MAG: hypothetical protein K2N48_04535 [Muribaculaceae bacterium]|nr:hypothetical protein [Muribaculaceae bacterium]